MSKLKLLTLAVIGLVALNLVVIGFLLFGGHNPRIPERLREQNGPKNIIIDRLQFDPNQAKQFKKLIDTHSQLIEALDDSLLMAKIDLYQTLVQEDVALKDFLVRKLGAIQQKIEETHYQHFLEIKALCKPEQLPAFNQLALQLANIFDQKRKNMPPPRELP